MDTKQAIFGVAVVIASVGGSALVGGTKTETKAETKAPDAVTPAPEAKAEAPKPDATPAETPKP